MRCLHHPEPAHQRHGRAQAYQAVERSRAAHRPACVLSDADGGKVGRDARPGPAGGAGRTTPRIIGVSSDTEGGTKVSGGEFAHRGLADNDGSRILHLRCDGGIPPRNEILEDHRTVSRRHVARFDLILEKNRNAMQRTHTP